MIAWPSGPTKVNLLTFLPASLINFSSNVSAIVFGITFTVEFFAGAEFTNDVCACAGKGASNVMLVKTAASFLITP